MTNSKTTLIAQDIAAQIRHKQVKVGDFLPSENQLAKLYGASRETIRKALEQLYALGMIQKIQGKGSMVLDLGRYSFPISGIESFAELNKSLGMNAKTKVLKLAKVESLPRLFAEKFPKEQQNKGIFLERLRVIDNEPEVLDYDFLFTPPISTLPLEAAQNSIYQYIEGELGLEISYATKTITVESATKEQQEKLAIENQMVVLVASCNYLSDTMPFQLTLSFHNPAKFKFVDFARRQNIKL